MKLQVEKFYAYGQEIAYCFYHDPKSESDYYRVSILDKLGNIIDADSPVQVDWEYEFTPLDKKLYPSCIKFIFSNPLDNDGEPIL